MSKRITKSKLESLIKQGKRRKAIAHYFKVTRRTIGRYIKRYGLKGIAKKGRPPKPRKPEAIKIKRFPRVWVNVQDYIQRLNEEYRFINIQSSPPYRFVNQKTLVCANSKRNPRGHYTTAGIYFIVYISNVYFLYVTRIRYTQNPVSFKEIYEWITANAESILEESYPYLTLVRIVAYTFSRPKKKPKAIRYG